MSIQNTKENNDISIQIAQLDTKLQLNQQTTEAVQKDLHALTKLMTGNGSPSTGVVVRLDRVEVTQSNQKWLGRMILAYMIASAIAYLFHFLHH